MEHDKYIEWMSAALDGELSPAERRELDAHLAECPECAALFRALSDQSAALRSLDCDAPEDLRDRILAGLPDGGGAAPIHKPARRRWGALAACAALVVAIGGAAALHGAGFRSGPDPRAGNAVPSGNPMSIAETPGGFSLEPPDAGLPFTQSLYLRVTWGAAPEAPSARIIGSADSLADFTARFPQDDLSALTDAYGDSFFETGRLLAVVLEEPSGSIRHELDPEGLRRDSVTVLREVPETATDDMAAWLLLAEVGPEFGNGDVLEVVFGP